MASSSSSSSRRTLHTFSHKMDYYKILRVSRDASTSDIKVSYRKLAMEYHPDRHDGCSDKEEQFKQINEAYSVLMDVARKRQYDAELGTRFRQRTNSWKHSKIYAPAPPPEWRSVWNHQRHYEMHYGDGIQKEAFRRMREAARREGSLEYQSPLGKGFSFEASDDPNDQVNPYSKAPQGPPKFVMEYEEIERDMVSGKEHLSRRDRIVEDLYQRRQERYNSSDTRQRQRDAQSAWNANAAFARRQQNDCVIL